MPQHNAPSEADTSARTSSEVSQWLYLHTALGKGYLAPFPYTPAWVISSGVPVELTYRMREAENAFHAHHENSVAADRAKLESLEALVQATKRTGVAPNVLTEIKSLKERLARPVFVNYRDWSADRSTMLELLSKSKFRAMSFVDELGVRAHNYTVNKFLAARHISADLALLSLTGDQSSDSVLIRSSATGGASMLSVRGADTPRFNLMTLTSSKAATKIHARLKEAAPCYGLTLVLPAPPSDTLQVPADQIARVIRKVYAVEDPADRVTVLTTPAWDKFLSLTTAEFAPSVAALGAMHKSLTSVQTLVRTVARAIVTRKFFLTERPSQEPDVGPDRTLQLTDDDLQLAQQWFRDLSLSAFGLAHLSVRRQNSASARDVWTSGPSAESCAAAKMALVSMIQADEHKMVAATSAASHPGITARTLDAILEANPEVFKVEANVRRPGAKRTAERMITLAAGWKTASSPVGGDNTGHPGEAHSDETKDILYRKWQTEAHSNFRNGGRPSIALADIPLAVRGALLGVQQRFWQTTTLVPSGARKGIGDPGVMELWFRNGPDGREMCVWAESFREWKLHEKWQAKDAPGDDGGVE